MNTKYGLTQKTILSLDGRKLHRIRALAEISGVVNQGELGGFVERETNLSACGDAWVYGDARVQFDTLETDIYSDWKAYIASSLNIYPIKGIYYLYKRVKKISDGKYQSCYDSKVVYVDGKVTRVKDFNPDIKISCSSGIHISTPFYWKEGDTLIAVKVKVSDVITCQEGKLRCKAVTTIGEVK